VHTTSRILVVLALALTLAGCDKCGNWFGAQAAFSLAACKSTVPQQ
jgi:predicted small secreted protein